MKLFIWKLRATFTTRLTQSEWSRMERDEPGLIRLYHRGVLNERQVARCYRDRVRLAHA